MTGLASSEHETDESSGQVATRYSLLSPPRSGRDCSGPMVDDTAASGAVTAPNGRVRPNIADAFGDLLALLDDRQRSGMISWLAVGFYDGWRPSRDEVADLVAIELGALTIDEGIQRQRRRRGGYPDLTDITPLIEERRGRFLTH
jgi:hypothetical protein